MTTHSPAARVPVLDPGCVRRPALRVTIRSEPEGRESAPFGSETCDAPLVRALTELTPEDGSTFGRQAVELGALKAAGFRVQDGFVLSTTAYFQSMTAAGVDRELAELHAAALHTVDPTELCARMTGLIRAAGPSAAVAAAVRRAYPGLGIEDFGPATVAVRLSPVGEWHGPADGSAAPLVVRGVAALLAAISDCWASVFSPAEVARRSGTGVALPAPAVIVQATVRVEVDHST